ncbi:uncharacterized protein il11b isoform X1 [Larimichthys crocea]|uniref:uncharacterized protein il11b isoform X1 n=1 Tax=Larimichthys crocea TaxID=215358 RepID=UPI000901B8F7|nr:uncharacterized protein LOC104924406 isoform X1 [Larimichthys crocea]
MRVTVNSCESSSCKHIIHNSASCLLRLLLLAELFVHSWSRPTSSPYLCKHFASMITKVEELTKLSKKLHELSDNVLATFAGVENRLDGLPNIKQNAEYFNSLQVNVSLSELYGYTQSFKLHVDWLKTVKENHTLSTQSSSNASTYLLQLSNQLNASLQQISAEVPQSPTPSSLPVVSTAFDELQFSVEISTRLQVFCSWTKRVLKFLQKLSRCHRH